MLYLTLTTIPYFGSVANYDKDLKQGNKNIDYTIKVVGPEPLPFQAIRLRLLAINATGANHGPIRELEGSGTRFRAEQEHLKLGGELRTWDSFSDSFNYKL